MSCQLVRFSVMETCTKNVRTRFVEGCMKCMSIYEMLMPVESPGMRFKR